MKSQFPHHLARASWATGILAVVVVMLTGQLGAKVIGDWISFCLTSIGAVAGILALACIPKYGRANLLGPACVGVLINGLLFTIWIPNYFQARHNVIAAREHEEGADWQLSRIPGLELLVPLPLTNVDSVAALRHAEKTLQLSPEQIAKAEESIKRVQIYGARGTSISVDVNRHLLLAGEDLTVDAQAKQMANMMQQQFPHGFRVDMRDAEIAGLPAKRLTIQIQIQGGEQARAECLVVFNQPYIWQIQFLGAANLPAFAENVARSFSSLRFTPISTKQ
jgi:hypothetical protein